MIVRCVLCLALLLLGQLPAAAGGTFDIKAFGAKGDGLALDTAPIQRAIDEVCAGGGGVVTIPPGIYRIGTLILKDNAHLHLEAGATLLGSPNITDYAAVTQKYPSRTRDLYAKFFMIFAEGARNISISGPGTIHGNGLEHFQVGDPQNMRPFMVRLVDCENVTIRDVRLLEAANWTLHLLGCRDVRVEGVVIENGADANRDGLDIDCCRRVTVADSRFSTGDDAIVLKTTNDDVCQDIAITNCIIRTRASAIKTGTESNGGFKNITVSNCVLRDIPVHAGIELMTVDGGMLQNVLLENITMDSVATPIFIRVGIRARPCSAGQYVHRIDDVRDISLQNISVTNAKLPSSIMGLHNRMIRNVTVRGYTVRYAETQGSIPYNAVPFEEFSYPAARVFRKLPAFGLYCRNVEQLRLQDLSLYAAGGETRPALTLDRVRDAELRSVRVDAGGSPLAHLRNTKEITADGSRTLGPSRVLFEVEDGTSVDFHARNSALQPGQKEILAVQALPDERLFDDFTTDTKFSVAEGETIAGLPAHDPGKAPLKVNLDVARRGELQLCLLMLNTSAKPEKVLVRYEGVTQEFLVDWQSWGWAPVSLLRQYASPRRVEFQIAAPEPASNLRIAKVYMRYLNLGHTD